MKAIQIIAPFSAATQWGRRENIETARYLGRAVLLAGAVPLVPHTIFEDVYGELDEAEICDRCLEMLWRADAVLTSPSYRISNNCKLELHRARQMGLPWLRSIPEMEAWIRGADRQAHSFWTPQEPAKTITSFRLRDSATRPLRVHS